MNEQEERYLKKFEDSKLVAEATSALLQEKLSVLFDFCCAVAASTPDPQAVLARFDRYRDEAKADEITDPTPAMELAQEAGRHAAATLSRLLRERA